MKRIIYFFATFALMLSMVTAQAQVLNRISRSVQNSAERTATRKVEQKAEQAATRGVERGIEAAERGVVAGRESGNSQTTAPTPAPAPAPYSGPVREAPADAYKFPFEQGSYVQIAQALGIEMKSTIYFTRSGEWKAIEDKSDVRIFGITTKVDKLHIIKGNKHWEIDLIQKSGNYYEVDTSPESSDAVLAAALGGSSTDGAEITELGQEEYMGYVCRKTQVKYLPLAMDVICLSYGSLVLKTDGYVGAMKTSSSVTSIDLTSPPASKFEVPAGINIDM